MKALSLPKEILAKKSNRRLLAMILLPLMVFLLVNAYVLFYMSKYETNRTYWLLTKKWQLLDNLQEKVDWLIIGDSSGNQSVDPDFFETEMGQTGLNLCTTGWMLTVDGAWMLQDYIEKHGPPENVLLVHAYRVWMRDSVKLGYLTKGAPLSTIFWKDYQPSLGYTRAEKWSVLLQRYFPLVSRDKSFKFLNENRDFIYRSFDDNEDVKSNGIIREDRPRPESVLKSLRRLNPNNPWKFNITSLNMKGLFETRRLAEKYKINTYFARGPIFNQTFYHPAMVNYFNASNHFFKNFCSSSEYLHFVNENSITFTENQMSDPVHLASNSVEEYTKHLIKEIIDSKPAYDRIQDSAMVDMDCKWKKQLRSGRNKRSIFSRNAQKLVSSFVPDSYFSVGNDALIKFDLNDLPAQFTFVLDKSNPSSDNFPFQIDRVEGNRLLVFERGVDMRQEIELDSKSNMSIERIDEYLRIYTENELVYCSQNKQGTKLYPELIAPENYTLSNSAIRLYTNENSF